MKTSIVGRITFWKLFVAALILIGIAVTFVRFADGLGASTNLTDETPWGLWIGFDLLVGVGLSAGGFVLAATVHIFGIEKYKPVTRPAILTAFLGYLLVIVALLFDLGQPWRIWHALIMWNHHSVMFEVAWCVMLYTTVLAFEFSPMLFEKLGWKVPLKIVRFIYIPLVILGVLLSTMHQSSLGSLYVIAPDKLHPLWYTSMLPVLFFTSAVAVGLSMTIFESYMSSRAFGRKLESDLLRGLARVAVVVLAVYSVIRLNDLWINGNLHLAFQLTYESTLFWGEFGLGVLLPMVLFAMPKVRHNRHLLFFAAMLAILGFVMNRMNVAITGMRASTGSTYFPSWMEIVVTATIVTVGFVLFGMAVKYLNVFTDKKDEKQSAEKVQWAHETIISGKVLAGLWVIILLGVVVVGFNVKSNETQKADSQNNPRSTVLVNGGGDLDLPEDYEFPAGEESPGTVIFSHESHVDYDQPDCKQCHQTGFSLHKKGTLLFEALDYKQIHEGDACASCHNGNAAFSIDDDCSSCHQ